jgi:Pvc16 N-terminal domain
VIHEVDDAVRSLLRQDAVSNDDVDIAFDAPNKEWAAKRSGPTVDVFLFDIREDIVRRRTEPERVRDDKGEVIGRRRPPLRFKLSYLVTAWTQRPEDEHRLLSSVLQALLHHGEMPRELLTGSLAEQSQPVYLTISLPPPPERSIGDIWSALGGELKPSLELVVSAPFPLGELRAAGPPVREQPRFTFDGSDGTSEVAPTLRRPFPGPRPASTGGEELPEAEVEETVAGGTDQQQGRELSVRTVGRRR